MNKLFVIEDETHAEQCGEYPSFQLALQELQRRSKIAWNLPPNKCPCTSSENCCRKYEVIEYETSEEPWNEIMRKSILTISKNEVTWETDEMKTTLK